jgi:hypothetical protein
VDERHDGAIVLLRLVVCLREPFTDTTFEIGRVHPAHTSPSLCEPIHFRREVSGTFGVRRQRAHVEREVKLGIEAMEEATEFAQCRADRGNCRAPTLSVGWFRDRANSGVSL